MATDISALGFSIIVKDSKIFPQGFTIKRTADGSDPFDFPVQTIGAATADANGYMVFAAEVNPINFTINLLPTTDEGENMQQLFNSHRPAAGRARTGGDITVTVQYADGRSVTAINVQFISGPPARSIQSPSRYKVMAFTFAAEDLI